VKRGKEHYLREMPKNSCHITSHHKKLYNIKITIKHCTTKIPTQLTRAQPHRQVCQPVVLRLPAAVRGEDPPVVALGEVHSGDGLRDGADLVDL
jgi:hypothetical protein